MVTYKIGEFELELSSGHIYNYPTLPATYDAVPLAVIMDAIAQFPERIAFIDVGANIGDTAAHVKAWDSRIPYLAIEPSEGFFQLLQKNAKAFSDFHALQALVVPEHLKDRIEFNAGDQTGYTKASVHRTALGIRQVTTDEIISMVDGKIAFKTDTDGFDKEIVNALLDSIKEHVDRVPLIYFEASSESENLSGDLDEWKTLYSRLIDQGYNLLFCKNDGTPYVNVGKCKAAAYSSAAALHISAKLGRMTCHYFDVIAYRDEASTDYLTLRRDWESSWARGQ